MKGDQVLVMGCVVLLLALALAIILLIGFLSVVM